MPADAFAFRFTLGELSIVVAIVSAVVYTARHFESRFTRIETYQEILMKDYHLRREETAHDDGSAPE